MLNIIYYKLKYMKHKEIFSEVNKKINRLQEKMSIIVESDSINKGQYYINRNDDIKYDVKEKLYNILRL